MGWKLAAVLQGKAKTQLLDTYSLERRKVAQMLINADREMSALVATKPNSKAAQSKVGTAEIEKFIARQNGFIAGTSIEYDPSFICYGHANQALASGYPVGQRFPSITAVRVADGRPTHLGHLVKADGRWRVFIFADAKPLNSSESEFAKLVSFLETSAQSPLNKYTPEGDDIDSVIDVYSVLQQQDASIEDMPGLLGSLTGSKIYYSTGSLKPPVTNTTTGTKKGATKSATLNATGNSYKPCAATSNASNGTGAPSQPSSRTPSSSLSEPSVGGTFNIKTIRSS